MYNYQSAGCNFTEKMISYQQNGNFSSHKSKISLEGGNESFPYSAESGDQNEGTRFKGAEEGRQINKF